MSRTYKDKPSKLKHELYDQDFILVENYGYYKYRLGKTTKTKKRKELDTEDHWMTTPSWWWRLMHHRPVRRAVHVWEKSVHKYLDEDVDLSICPDHGNKPHQYFW